MRNEADVHPYLKPPRRRVGLVRRFFRALGFLIVVFLLVTALPVAALRWVDPFSSAFMVRAALTEDGDYSTRYSWVDMNRISPHAAIAVVAAEDQQFPFHLGFDLASIRKAVESNGRSHKVRGASTISQQVAKNLFLWPGKSYVRKGLEAYFTVLIEVLWPKQRILEVYLNIAEFGKGVYGVESAAQRFFKKPASRLTRSEAATLAAVLPSPRRMRADRPSRYVSSRRDWILGQMRGLGGAAYLKAAD